MLDDSEEIWVDHSRLMKETQSLEHSVTMKNRPGPNKGKIFGSHTEEENEANRLAHLGRETTEEWAANISKAKKGVPQTQEHIAALTAARNTPEHKKLRSEALSKFTYHTPLGVFPSRLAMFEAYKNEPITQNRLIAWSNLGRNGFSRKSIDV